MGVLGLLMFLLPGCNAARQGAVIMLGGFRVAPATHAIFLPEKPTITEQTAADELRLHLQLVTGQTLDVLPETTRGDRHGFFVGRCSAYPIAPSLLSSLGHDGLIIRTHGSDVQLAGNQRGVLYAVSVFLEDYLRCRWFTSDCMTYPTRGTIRISDIDRRYVPPLTNRATDSPEHHHTLFAMRSRFTSSIDELDATHGGMVLYYPWVHSFFSLVPPGKYFDSHPEYFALVDGKRQRGGAQLCLTNPEVLRIAIAQVRQWIKESPDVDVISVSQNDTLGYCQCPACAALAQAEGSQSGPILHFVNAIADAIRQEYPGKTIDTLAYIYSRKPPLHVRPRPNVTVRLCSFECCFSHPLATCPENAAFLADLKGWSAICDHLSVWDYVLNYSHALGPFPNLYVLGPNIRTYVGQGVTNIYAEDAYFTRGAEMASLRTYILAKTLWDPAYDTNKAIDEFTTAYYGAAGPYIRKYIELVHAPFKNGGGGHVHVFGHDPAGIMGPRFVAQAQALFQQARQAVRNDPVRFERVRLAHLPVIYMILKGEPVYCRTGDTLRSDSGGDVTDWAAEFREIVAHERITRDAEARDISDLSADLPRYPERMTIERLCNGSIEVEYLPEYGGRVLSLKASGYGNEWFSQCGAGDRMRLRDGSEIYSGAKYESPGWSESFDVVRRTGSSIVMRTHLANGLEVERELSLGAGPTLRERVSLRNTTDQPREATLRIHPSFAVADAPTTCVLIRDAAGQWRRDSLPGKPDDHPAYTDRTYRGQEMPAGAWGLLHARTGRALIDRVMSGKVDRCFTHMDWANGRLTLELWSPTRSLAPGEAVVIEHEYELIDRWAGAKGSRSGGSR